MYQDPRIVKVAGYRANAKMATLNHILFLHIQISLTNLVPKYKIQKNKLSQARLVRLILIYTKNINPAAILAFGPCSCEKKA